MFSFVVSIYKIEAYLKECVDSLLSQQYENFEIILVDDGSPDRCPAICDDYAKLDARVKVIHKKNGGLVSARKAGLQAAQGEYICFVDGDDTVNADMLTAYHAILQKHAVDMICCGYTEYYTDHLVKRHQNVPLGFYGKDQLEKDMYHRMLSTEPLFTFYLFPSICTKCIKKEIALKIYQSVPDNITLGEDAAVTYPALLLADSIYVSDYDGYMYRQNPDSMTHTYDSKLFERVSNLLTYMRNIDEKRYHLKKQMDEYTIFLLNLSATNELLYNTQDAYKVKKANLKKYLNSPIFADAIICTKSKVLKYKILLFCFRHKLIDLLYLLKKR